MLLTFVSDLIPAQMRYFASQIRIAREIIVHMEFKLMYLCKLATDLVEQNEHVLLCNRKRLNNSHRDESIALIEFQKK